MARFADMHATRHILLLLSSTFAALVTATALLRDLTPSVNLTKPSGLTWDPIKPWGPDEFTADIERETVGISSDALFVTAIHFVAEQAAQVFEGELPSATTIFRDPNYPSLSIAVSSTGPRRRVLRRYVLWGLARILNTMVYNGFRASIVVLKYRNAVVGRILIVANGRNALEAGFKDVAITQPRLDMPTPQQISNNTQLSVGEGSNALGFDFEFWGEELVKQDVMMATLGGLIQVAQHTNHPMNNWVGSFPGFHCFHTYLTSVHPPVMNKETMIVTMVAAMAHGLLHNNWHELRLNVTKDQQQILSGGYLDFPFPPGQQGVSSS